MDQIFQLFNEMFEGLDCLPETKSYIVSIFSKYKFVNSDLSKENITLIFLEANQKRNFEQFQNVADWIFFCRSLAPEHLKFASKDFYCSLGQLSYWNCYKIVNRQWKLFEELSDNFAYLSNQTSKLTYPMHFHAISKFLL